MSTFGPNVHRVVAELDPRGNLDVSGLAVGPAGASTVSLIDGLVTVSVDTASPADLVGLRIDADAPPVDEILAALVGPHFAQRIERARNGGGRGRRMVLWRDDPTIPSVRTGGRIAEVGRLALATTEARRSRFQNPGRISLGLAEAAVLTANLGPGISPTPSAPDLARAAARWIVDAPGPLLVEGIREAPILLRELIGSWESTLRDLDPETDALIAYLRQLGGRAQPGWVGQGHSGFDSAIATRAAMAPPWASTTASAVDDDMAQGAAPTEVELGSFSFRADVGEESRLIKAEVQGSDLTVHVATDSYGDLWLRVFGGSPHPVLIALAPFDVGPRAWRSATALVPRSHAPHELLVDVTAEPAQPWHSPAAVSTERAIDLGIRAARRTRLDPDTAAQDWHRCANAWKELGQADKTSRALNLAYSAASEIADPLAVDLLSIDPAV